MPKPQTENAPATSRFLPAFAGIAAGALLVLLLMFYPSLSPGKVVFSNDGPLGASSAAFYSTPGIFKGVWQDLNWVGGGGGAALPSVTNLLLWVLKPVGFAKFYAPACLFLLALSAWLFFRQLGFRPVVCVLGGLAAASNTDFFSYACWGLGTLTLAVAGVFLALAALVTPSTRSPWLKGALAGLAVGWAVMEGADSGAILSVYVAAFILFVSQQAEGDRLRKWLKGLAQLALVALMAAFLAAQALSVLVGTQIKGVAGMEQDKQSVAERWNWATQWSLPKIETLRVVIPGLFGYRMDTPGGGNYWGGVGQAPGVIQSRHSGSGVYGGVLVVVVAFWAAVQSLRKSGGLLAPAERRMTRFWLVALVVSLLFAWGRHAPFYKLVYALPYFSTIRNPIKYMHPFHIALVILFGCGLQALWRQYAEKTSNFAGAFTARLKAWWAGAPAFDKQWTRGLVVSVGASFVGWLLYAASRTELEAYLKKAFPPSVDLASAVASFSLREVGWFILFLIITAAVMVLILSGTLSGSRAKWAGLCLFGLLVTDMSRANAPWVMFWDIRQKYASNPLIDFLRQNPWEQRVIGLPFAINEQMGLLSQFYNAEWLQHLFQYYNIQSLDVIQEPRGAAENVAYRTALLSQRAPGYFRVWELTNTRFLVGLAGGLADALNQQLDPVKKRFREHTRFTLEQEKAGSPVTVRTNVPGPFALLEFAPVLPRVKLYSRWQVNTNDQQVLKTLADADFDPWQTVLVSNPIPEPQAGASQEPGTVEFVSYAPKAVDLRANVTTPCVLLLNDKFAPEWELTVNGERLTLLRCNYLMRGAYLAPGQHLVQFRYKPDVRAFYVSLLAWVVGAALVGMVVVRRTNPPLHPGSS